MSPALAIARNEQRVRDKGALFWARMFPLAFRLALLASGRFWLRARVCTERGAA